MDDKVFYGNILGLLKKGRWSLDLDEASALVLLSQECKKRYEGKIEVIDNEPIKEASPQKKKKMRSKS